MNPQDARAFSPRHEREGHARAVERLRRAPLRRPGVVLVARPDLGDALEAHLAAAGGGFARVCDWGALCTLLDDVLDLPALPSLSDLDRAQLVERCLDGLATTDPALRASLRSDPFGLSLSLLGVLDALRHHGPIHPPRTAVSDAAGALIAGHLRLLSSLVARYEAALAEAAALDLPARLRRLCDGLATVSRPLPMDALTALGIDLITPLEQRFFDALAARGVALDVQTPSPAMPSPADLAELPRPAAIVCARDPHDEADAVARWIAEHVARGALCEDFAVAVAPSVGAADRMARALARYGLASHGGGRSAVHQSPLWQTFRASIRLAWRGVDVIDLATALASPGSGIWGGDRDFLVAELRRHTPASWKSVREVLTRCTTLTPSVAHPDALEALDAADDEGTPIVVELDAPDPARAAQLAEVRARVEELISEWESAGPIHRLPAVERLAALQLAVRHTLGRFVQPQRFRDALDDARTSVAWVAASESIRAACDKALERFERTHTRLGGHDPGVFLTAVASLLGATADGVAEARADGVALLVDAAFVRRRPKTLVVTGFYRGRLPSAVGRPLLLGPLEQEQLRQCPGFEDFPDEATRARMALREAHRVLSLPTETLVVTRPARLADGAVAEASLAARELLPADLRWITPDAWLRASFSDGPRTAYARRADSLRHLGASRVAEALALASPLAAESLSARDLFAARLRPDRRFDVADLVAPTLSTAVFTPRALETLLKCRYSFLTGPLLGIRPLPLARAPSLAARDKSRVARAALRALDAVVDPTPKDLHEAMERAIADELPWADRPDMRFSLEELRRAVAPFLARYAELRGRWGLHVAQDDSAAAHPVSLALPGGGSVRLAPLSSRIETRVAADGAQRMLMDFRVGSTEPMRHLREAGLDLDAALGPAIAAAQSGEAITSFVRLSLSRAEAELIPGEDGRGPDPREVRTTLVALDASHPLESLQTEVIARISAELDALADAHAQYAPHDAARAQELSAAGARSCEFCAMRLGCRFKMAGGA